MRPRNDDTLMRGRATDLEEKKRGLTRLRPHCDESRVLPSDWKRGTVDYVPYTNERMCSLVLASLGPNLKGIALTRLLSSANAASENIRAYEKFVADSPDLINRLAMHRAWYAVRDGNAWRFGNSKFIGYADMTPDKYLAGGLDGKKTEKVLQEWFVKVEPDESNYAELRESLERFLKVHDKSPNKQARVNVLKNEVTSVTEKNPISEDEEDGAIADPVQTPALADSYVVDNIVGEGCFLERPEIERLFERLLTRKNLILQGPPGTGKTWIAKRLAFALMGKRDEDRVRAVQFHPNLSYEDFVRGWRPSGDGKLTLSDGVFMEMIRAALSQPNARFVVIIEEINRGNPAQIFGEMLTLLEAGKRTPREALELCYPDSDGKRRPVHVPENLFVIGTMNTADRSLALIDLAFRRRFAFVELEPRMGKAWRQWVTKTKGVDPDLVDDIKRRIVALNAQIADVFGRQFEIGHSYVTPTEKLEPGATREWFRQVAETEIGPLLAEYWFDAQKSAQEARNQLLQEW